MADSQVETPQSVAVTEMSQNTQGFLDRFFRLSERKTDVRTEVFAGLTTFMTMCYIIFVNPQILSDAGIPKEGAIAATIFASVFCTLLFGLWANFPVAIAPGMGLNAFFTYSVVLGQGLSWQTALGAVFISGLVFFLLTVTGIRRRLVAAVPDVLRSAIVVGIGLFIAFIGLKNAGIIVKSPATFVTLGQVTKPGPILTMIGLLVAVILMARNIKGAMIISILVTTLLAMAFGVTPVPHRLSDVMTFTVPDITTTLGKLDIMAAIHYGIFSIIFSFTIVELFDNLATLIGLSKKAGLMDKNGDIPNLNRALQADAVGTMMSATFGSTALNAYIENAAGISEGGRTGLTAVVVAGLFLLSLFLTPLIMLIPSVATAPALILVGSLMLSEIKNLSFDDFTDTVPAFLTIILMPLTSSIAEGLAFGFVSYTVLKTLTGKYKEMNLFLYLITAAFIINFLYHG